MIWFRMLWMMFAAHWRRPIDIMDEHRLTFHCLPTDLDLNRHLTNSRFHSFMDQVRFDLILRSGVWRRLRAQGVGPVLGSSSIRFRKQIRPWQRFEVTARILSWDERWIYMEQRVLAAGETAAVAIVKTAFVDRNGRIAPERCRPHGTRPAEAGTQSDLIAAKNTA